MTDMLAIEGTGGCFCRRLRWVVVVLLALAAWFAVLPRAEALAATSTDWRWPTDSESYGSGWPNYSSGKFHGGTDISVPLGTPVYATCDMEVVYTKTLTDSYGKHIVLVGTVNGETTYFWYAHLNDFAVEGGQEVSAGQLIGHSGSTGNSTGPHLHYEVRDSSNSHTNGNLNPRLFMPGSSYEYELNHAPDLPFKSCIDYPTGGQSFDGNLYVQGWAIWKTPPTRILYSINGGAEKELSFYYRDDVHNAYPAYPTENNGWQGYISNAAFKSGTNNIEFTADFSGERKTIGSCTVNNTYSGNPPTVSDVRITNVTADGYTVTCKVIASNGLKSVAFPTWTVLDGQDDITWDRKKVTGNNATVGYNVKVEAHGSRHGLYCTHVYAYDELGYESCATANDIIVPTAMTTTDESTYLLVNTDALRSDWLGARDVVSSSWQGKNLGAHLVAITSQEEQDVVAALAHETDGLRFGYWMGLNSIDSEEFSWTSGEEVTYTNWGEGQPAVADNKLYGALMWDTGKWENLTRTATSSGYVVDGRTNMGFIMEVPNAGGGLPALSEPSVVYDEDGGGFTAKVKVRSDANVAYVLFPVWTVDDTSDVRWESGTISNGYATYHVRKSDFGHKGPYHVHAYAYDAADNIIGFVSVKQSKTIMLPASKAAKDGHVYYVVDKMAAYETAEGWANKFRGEYETDGMRSHLVTIESAEEQRLVVDLVAQSDYPYHWIGLSDASSEGQFCWATGQVLDYTNWASGDPNGGSSENHVLMATSDGTWRDAPNETNVNEQPIGYIVEFDPLYADYDNEMEPILSNPKVEYDGNGLGFTVSVDIGGDMDISRVQFATWAASDRSDLHWYEGTVRDGVASYHVEKADFGHKGPFYVNAYARDNANNVLQVLDIGKNSTIMLPAAKATFNGHVYYAVDKAAKYTAAEAWADSYRGDAETTGMKSHLATVESAEEQTVLSALAEQADYPLHWIGLTDEDSEGDFRWVTGEEFSYTNWKSGQPDGGSSENYVAYSTEDASWVDLANIMGLQAGDYSIGYFVEFEPLVAQKPVAEATLTYTGTSQSVIAPGFGFSLSGDLSATEVGTYHTTATLVEGYTWDDGTTDVVYCTWSITKASGNTVTLQDLTFTYDGLGHCLEEPVMAVEGSEVMYSLNGKHWMRHSPEFFEVGSWTVYAKAVNDNYEDSDVAEASVVCEPATLVATYVGETIREGEVPNAEIVVTGFIEGDEDDEYLEYEAPVIVLPEQLKPGVYTLTPQGGMAANYIFEYVPGTLTVTEGDHYDKDGWVDLPGGRKGYALGGRLVTGWLSVDGGKYWFHEDGTMATGWTDVVVDGKVMHYYFNPASGNLVRGTWFQIDDKTYYFRPSGNLATGWATISDSGVDKKYYFEADGTLVKGTWRDIENGAGATNHYYFRPSGAMATGWATIDGQKYWFRPSGNMATGFADVDDAYKRYFDGEGHMLTGWQEIGGRTYYFRASGAMQTGSATIDGVDFVFSDKGILVSGGPAAGAAEAGDDGAGSKVPDGVPEAGDGSGDAVDAAEVSDGPEAEGPAAAGAEPDGGTASGNLESEGGQGLVDGDDKVVAEGTLGTCAWHVTGDGDLVIGPADGEGEGMLPDMGDDAEGAPSGTREGSGDADAPEGEGRPGDDTSEAISSWLEPDVAGLVTRVTVLGGTRAGKSIAGLFAGLDNLEAADLRGLDVSSVEDASRLFDGCSSLREVDLIGWDLASLEVVDDVFRGCENLESIAVSDTKIAVAVGVPSGHIVLVEEVLISK